MPNRAFKFETMSADDFEMSLADIYRDVLSAQES
jgi:hypothetical protein